MDAYAIVIRQQCFNENCLKTKLAGQCLSSVQFSPRYSWFAKNHKHLYKITTIIIILMPNTNDFTRCSTNPTTTTSERETRILCSSSFSDEHLAALETETCSRTSFVLNFLPFYRATILNIARLLLYVTLILRNYGYFWIRWTCVSHIGDFASVFAKRVKLSLMTM